MRSLSSCHWESMCVAASRAQRWCQPWFLLCLPSNGSSLAQASWCLSSRPWLGLTTVLFRWFERTLSLHFWWSFPFSLVFPVSDLLTIWKQSIKTLHGAVCDWVAATFFSLCLLLCRNWSWFAEGGWLLSLRYWNKIFFTGRWKLLLEYFLLILYWYHSWEVVRWCFEVRGRRFLWIYLPPEGCGTSSGTH